MHVDAGTLTPFARTPARSRGWLGPLAPPRGLARAVDGLAAAAEPLVSGGRWLPLALLAGALPIALSWRTGWQVHRPLTASLLLLPWLACVRADRWRAGLGLLAAGFAAHSAVVVCAATWDPRGAEAVLSGSAAYWRHQWLWIESGWDPEYEWSAWVPAHGLQLAGNAVCSYASLGWLTLNHGLEQVDWMNFYTARLAAFSKAPLLAGWHLWSVVRGLGFLFVTYEAASWSLERLTAQALSTRALRIRRWAWGLGLLLMDAALKAVLLEPTREILYTNLL
ncbi:MAG: hypothetical protein L6R28_08830 [Planctomycetes bacterium]|nr:hypothetical protein [Planctomycetota bacterium]